MLHEEVTVTWNTLQEQIQESKLLEALQMDFVPGVMHAQLVVIVVVVRKERLFFLQGVTVYIGRRRRTRDVLQKRMYISEVTKWMLEADEMEHPNELNVADEALINARLIAA